MSKRLVSSVAALTIAVGGSTLLARPAAAAERTFDCTALEIVGVINDLCPNGGRATNIQQSSDGCSFGFECY